MNSSTAGQEDSLRSVLRSCFNAAGVRTDNPGLVYGVEIQAHAISQIISAALDGRSLLSSLAIWQETVWVGIWSITGGLLAFYVRQTSLLLLFVGGSCSILFVTSSFALIIFSLWIPLVPAFLAMGSSIICMIYVLSNEPNLYSNAR